MLRTEGRLRLAESILASLGKEAGHGNASIQEREIRCSFLRFGSAKLRIPKCVTVTLSKVKDGLKFFSILLGRQKVEELQSF